MSFELDSINTKIIKLLKNGRESLTNLSQHIPVSENTIKSRIQKMTDAGILDVTALIDPGMVKGHQVIYIGMQVLNLKFFDKAKEIGRLKGVVSVSVVTGRYDLIVVVHLSPGFGIFDFLSDELTKVKDIALTETYVVYKSVNLKIPPVSLEEK